MIASCETFTENVFKYYIQQIVCHIKQEMK